MDLKHQFLAISHFFDQKHKNVKCCNFVNIWNFLMIFFKKPTLLALKRSKIMFLLCFDPIWGYISTIGFGQFWGPVKILIKSKHFTFLSRIPKSRWYIPPDRGQKHNINMIFERFSASRVGFKQIPMKNCYGNQFFVKKKWCVFWSDIPRKTGVLIAPGKGVGSSVFLLPT